MTLYPRETLSDDDQHQTTTVLSGGRWREWLGSVFIRAFEWLGFGAKTSVGYGAMAIDHEAMRESQRVREKHRQDQEEKAKKLVREGEKELMTPAKRAMADLFDQRTDQRTDQNQDERAVLFIALKTGRLAEHQREAAQRLKTLMQEQKRWKEKTEKKNPEKDQPYQDTLLVQKWLST